MRAANATRFALLVVATGVGACLSEPPRSFYDDLDAGGNMATDGSVGSDGTVDATSTDATMDVGDGSSDGTTDGGGSEAADAPNDAGTEVGPDARSEAGAEAGEAGADTASEAEAGCGPTNTVANCGACGLTCDTAQSVGASCNGVSCAYTGCAPGYGDCVTTGPPNFDGCETRLNTTSNCTGCGLACETMHSLGPSCNGTTCAYSGCAPGYADCFAAAPNVDGCETPINTIAHCTACGTKCDTTHSLGASCGAGGCAYTGCTPGWTSCNSTPPNAVGCGCNTPACCGTNCQTTHSNGLGNSFYDCQPPGTYTQAQARAACVAFTGDAAKCNYYPCANMANGPIICSDLSLVSCACWSYGGGNVGHVNNSGISGTCYCPATTDQTWN